MARRGRPPSPDILTPREAEVVELVAQGLTNAAIADRLGISEQGVKYHLNQVYAKRELASREELIAWTKARQRWRLPAILAPIAKAGALVGAGTVGALVITAIVTGSAKHADAPAATTPSPQLTVVGSLAAQVVCTGDSPAGSKGTQLYTARLPGTALAAVGTERFYDSVMLTADGAQARISASQQTVLVNVGDGSISGLPRAALGLDGYPPGTWSPDGRYQATVGLPMYIFDRAGDVVAEVDYDSPESGAPPPGPVRYGGGFAWSADSSTFATIQSGLLVLLSTDGHTSVTDTTKTLGLDESMITTPMSIIGTKGGSGLVIQPQKTPVYFVVTFEHGVLDVQGMPPAGGSILAFGAGTIERGVALTSAISAAVKWAGHPLTVSWQRPDGSGRGEVAALKPPAGTGAPIFVVADERSRDYAIFAGPQCDPSGNEDLVDATILTP